MDYPRLPLLLLVLLLIGCGAPSRSARTGDTATVRMTPTSMLSAAHPALASGRPYAYVVDYYHAIRVIDPRSPEAVHTLPVGRSALPVFSPDGSRLYVTHHTQPTGDAGARLDIFDVATGRSLAKATGLELMAYKIWGPPIVAPKRDGSTVYIHGRRIGNGLDGSGRDHCWIYRFDVAANRLAPDTIPLPACRVAPLLLSPDGRTLYSGSWLIDLTTQPASVHENPALSRHAVAQSAAGRWLYALGRDGRVTIWDADARRAVRTLTQVVPRYGSFVYLLHASLQVSRDGTVLHIATDGGDSHDHSFKSIMTVDAATGQQLGVLDPEHAFRSFTVSADSREYYLISERRPARDTLEVALEFWDIASGTRRASVGGIGGSAGPVLAPPPP